MAKCWEERGCDEEMQSDCMHHTTYKDRCPAKCVFANSCPRPTHVVTTDPDLLFDATLDRDNVIKETCLYCEFYLKNGPRQA
jgi:hypothetical protein